MLIAQLLWNRDVFKWKCFYLILLNTQIQHLSLSEQKKSAQSSRWSTPFELVPVFITWSHLELIALDHILDELLFACRLLYSCSNLSVLPLSDYILLVDEKQCCEKYLSQTQNPITLYILKSVCIFSINCSLYMSLGADKENLFKSFFMWWLFPQFSWPSCVTQGWYCTEKSKSS